MPGIGGFVHPTSYRTASDRSRCISDNAVPDTFAVIRTIIGAKDGKAVAAPFVDITHKMRERTGRN